MIWAIILACGLTTCEMVSAVFAQNSIKSHNYWFDAAGLLSFVVMYWLYRQTLINVNILLLTALWIAVSSIAAVVLNAQLNHESINVVQLGGMIGLVSCSVIVVYA